MLLLSEYVLLTSLAALTGTVFSKPHSGSSDVPRIAARATACNNSPDLCSRAYNNITHMGAHDSSFLRDASTNNSLAGNQFFNATTALDAGIRLLQGQVHNVNGVIELCHTTCDLLDAGMLQDWLTVVRVWMDANLNEVVTLLLVNSDNFDTAAFGPVFSTSGIDRYGYTPTGTGTWPTLQDMISSNKRLVTFIASIEASSTYPYLLSEFDYVFETAYEVTSPDGFNCTLDRPSSQPSSAAALSAGLLPLVNHFQYDVIASSILIPAVDDIATTNSPSTDTTGALGLHAQTCRGEWNGIKPTFMLVNFYSEGPAISTADALNGIVEPVGRNAQNATSPGSDAGPEKPNVNATDRSGSSRLRHSRGASALVAFLVAALVLA